MINLNDNINNILLELKFEDMFGNLSNFNNNINKVSELFNDIVKLNFNNFNKLISKSDFSRINLSGSIEIQRLKFIDIVNDNILKIKSGEFFNLPENKDSGLTDLYNKLISVGINKEKLDNFIISIYEDFAKVKNMKDLYPEIQASFFKAKVELIQKLSIDELKQIQSNINIQTNNIPNKLVDTVLKFEENRLFGKSIVLAIILIVLLIMVVINKLKKNNLK